MKIIKDCLLKNFTVLKIGGEAKYFIIVKNEDEFWEALSFAKQRKLPWRVAGEGSNLVVSDAGYRGVVIQNQISKIKYQKKLVVVGAGNNLLKFIYALNHAGYSGLERMAGIPGTVGGAIYGCAGAYGQEIKDRLVRVKIFDGTKIKYLTKKQCRFGYRESIFKNHRSWIIVEAVFRLKTGDGGELNRISRAIIKLRQKKYWPGLKCPGSFFKNFLLADIYPLALRQKFVKKIESDKIMYGKVSSGYLLEEVGAKGMRQGSIRVANHHANLIYNTNGGKASDIKKLAKELKTMVHKHFGIKIEEEVQYL